MTAAEPYPMLTIPSHQLYEIAHLATFIAGALSRRRQALERGARNEARAAARDAHLGRQALAAATNDPTAATSELPRPIDNAAYKLAEELQEASTHRRANIVSLAPLGRNSWAVTGYVPGIGMVGAEVADITQAAAIKEHLLTQPADHLTDWAVTSQPMQLDRTATRDRESLLVEAPQAVHSLDPTNPQHIALAKHLRNSGPLNAAVRDNFAEVDLDEPVPRVQPGDPTATSAAAQASGSIAAAASATGQHQAAVQRAESVNAESTPATAAAARAQVALTPTDAAAARSSAKQHRQRATESAAAVSNAAATRRTTTPSTSDRHQRP